MSDYTAGVADRRPVPRSRDEWGPDCVRCGADEYRIDGYCSCECRDSDELEREILRLETELDEARAALALAKSIILSGESLSPQAEEQIDAALSQPSKGE